MTGKRRFEEQLAALEQLRVEPPQASIEPLRKALTHRSNYIVAKAADLVREFRLPELIPELLVAFDRCFGNPIKTDPQCWAKNAISRALAALGHGGTPVAQEGVGSAKIHVKKTRICAIAMEGAPMSGFLFCSY